MEKTTQLSPWEAVLLHIVGDDGVIVLMDGTELPLAQLGGIAAVVVATLARCDHRMATLAEPIRPRLDPWCTTARGSLLAEEVGAFANVPEALADMAPVVAGAGVVFAELLLARVHRDCYFP